MSRKIVDVVVVGGGPAGISAAITLARAGKEVVVVERGDYPGSKNVFGGAIYAQPTAEIFPEFWKSAPVERYNTEHKYAILGDNDGTVIGYKNDEHSKDGHYNSFTIIRAKWDRWCAQQAAKAGAYIVPQTLATELIEEDGKFVGIRTEQEDVYAKITIVADGVNSILAKQAGIRKEIKSESVALAVKEVINLPKEKIEDRFNLEENSGAIYTIVGGPMQGMTGLGYIYTNLDSVVIGIGVSLEDLKHHKKKPYDMLNALKDHPSIRPLIKGGELREYSAHLIPEGGYKCMPKLYRNGLMIAGDAAMLVNNIHWEGTNLAMKSGMLAAKAAIEALQKDDFSENSLYLYQKMLEDSFVIKDLKTYKDVMPFIEKNSKIFLGFYPQKLNQFFNMFTTVDSIPKKEKYKEFISSTLSERNPLNIACDAVKLAKLAGGILL